MGIDITVLKGSYMPPLRYFPYAQHDASYSYVDFRLAFYVPQY